VPEGTVCTVDSFLMDEHKWKPYGMVLCDEALQQHAGAIMAIKHITGAKIRGYGDSEQILYMPFTRFAKPAAKVDYPWDKIVRNWITRRIPDDNGRIMTILRNPLLYGPQFHTINENREIFRFYASMTSMIESLDLSMAYDLMGLDRRDELLILCFLQDEASTIRAKLRLTREKLPPEADTGQYGYDYPATVCTVGEAQGDNVPNVLLLMPSTVDQPLYASKSHTVVALSRHFRSFGLLRATSQFPSLIEVVAGPTMAVAGHVDLLSRL